MHMPSQFCFIGIKMLLVVRSRNLQRLIRVNYGMSHYSPVHMKAYVALRFTYIEHVNVIDLSNFEEEGHEQ